MKRLFSLIAIAALCSGIALHADERISPSQLPAPLKEYISTTFGKDVQVVAAELDREGYDTEYDVMLSNGVRIEYASTGQWIEVQGPSLGQEVVGQKIANYVKQHHPKAVIQKIERKAYGYEVELNTGLELKFDKDCAFIRASR